jgi:hypothetical protein
VSRFIIVLTATVALAVGLAGAAQAAPSNDDFDSAAVISALPFSDTVDMTTASVAADDPSDPCANPLGATVWYTFAPSVNTPVAFDTFGSTTAAACSSSAPGKARPSRVSGSTPPPR